MQTVVASSGLNRACLSYDICIILSGFIVIITEKNLKDGKIKTIQKDCVC